MAQALRRFGPKRGTADCGFLTRSTDYALVAFVAYILTY
jgi:hypothetical protein